MRPSSRSPRRVAPPRARTIGCRRTPTARRPTAWKQDVLLRVVSVASARKFGASHLGCACHAKRRLALRPQVPQVRGPPRRAHPGVPCLFSSQRGSAAREHRAHAAVKLRALHTRYRFAASQCILYARPQTDYCSQSQSARGPSRGQPRADLPGRLRSSCGLIVTERLQVSAAREQRYCASPTSSGASTGSMSLPKKSRTSSETMRVFARSCATSSSCFSK